MKLWSILVLLGPLVGAIVAGGFGVPKLKSRTHFASILGVGIALLASLMLLIKVVDQSGAGAVADSTGDQVGAAADHSGAAGVVAETGASQHDGAARASSAGEAKAEHLAAAATMVTVYQWLPRVRRTRFLRIAAGSMSSF